MMSEYRNYNNMYEGNNIQNNPYAGGWNTASDPSQNKQPKKHSPSKAGRIAKKIGAITLSAVLFGGVASGTFQAVNYLTAPADVEEAQSTSSSGSNAQVLTTSSASATTATGTMDVSSIAEAVMPSIVSITNRSVQEVENYFSMFGYGAQTTPQETESVGSGIIIGQNDSELLVVTNYHVIENADSLSVCFIDNNAYEANVKGTDAANDLAVISVPLSSISSDTMSQISVATLGNSDSLRVGEQVVAIGNALGYGQSVTTGIVSATNRTLTNVSTDGSSSTNTYIQTDAAINPGNSGGALVNMSGEVIGINSAKLASTEVEGMGYAIPTSRVSDIISTLMSETTRTRVAESEQGSLGISVIGVSESVTSAYGIPTGVYVAEVTPGSSAETAGLRRGDVITAFDGRSVTDVSQLQDVMQYYKAGETVELTLQSIDDSGSYAEKTVSITLSASSSSESGNGIA